jgi:cephalosporin-C deacetylase-like acetyl esterase
MMMREKVRGVQEKPAMRPLSRREFLYHSLAASAGLARSADAPAAAVNVHQQILDLAARLQEQRRNVFGPVRSMAQLKTLQQTLRQKFLDLLGGLPAKTGVPPVQKLATLDGDDYQVDKLVFQSYPGYFVPALLYRPRKKAAGLPGVLSPCGHSTVGKAEDSYQKLHINLVKRGYIVLTYDPVGQGERSQFWDAAKSRSRFNLACGEHAVLGNPLYLLGTSLARYRIWDGMRALDYLTSLPEVDASKIGCVGNSGGGTLTAYIAALDPRVAVAAICCYITTLPRRMGNRIQKDSAADPEQDIFGFVSQGIDHAGLLALRVPKPTLLGTARFDFFPIEGTRETFAEVKSLYESARAGEHFAQVEAAEQHGLTLPLREAVYRWFDRWLYGRTNEGRDKEMAVTPRAVKDLQVCADGQVHVTFHSRPLLVLAREEFEARKGKPGRVPLKNLLHLDPAFANFHAEEIAAGGADRPTLLLCINGNETASWQRQKEFLAALVRAGHAVTVMDPRGVGKLRPNLEVKGHDYGDPLSGVEENIAYNAFLVGKSLLGMRVADVLAAVSQFRAKWKPRRVVLCGRRDAALVACFAACLEPAIERVATENMRVSYWSLFEPVGRSINAASVLPRMLRDFGDIPDVLAQIAPRQVLLANPREKPAFSLRSVKIMEERLIPNPERLLEWLG